MVKKVISFAMIVFVSCLFNISSFASVTGDKTDSITLENGDSNSAVNLSKNVHADYASASGNAYSASTYNDKGTQTYLTGSWTTYIYYADQKAFPSTFTGASSDEPASNDATWKAIGE
jgi:putative salt-induced outer membrane protein YdiY